METEVVEAVVSLGFMVTFSSVLCSVFVVDITDPSNRSEIWNNLRELGYEGGIVLGRTAGFINDGDNLAVYV